MKFLQKLGKALMLPVAVLPICGILMGIGYYLCPATMQGGDIEGVKNLIGFFLYCICCFIICMAIAVRSTCCTWRCSCRYECCGCWYLRILKPSVDPNWITSRIKQRILV